MGWSKEERAEYMKTYYLLNRNRMIENSLSWQLKNPEKAKVIEKKRNRTQIDKLKDAYVKKLLRAQGFPKEAITPELIELKRITIKTKRLCRQLKA